MESRVRSLKRERLGVSGLQIEILKVRDLESERYLGIVLYRGGLGVRGLGRVE